MSKRLLTPPTTPPTTLGHRGGTTLAEIDARRDGAATVAKRVLHLTAQLSGTDTIEVRAAGRSDGTLCRGLDPTRRRFVAARAATYSETESAAQRHLGSELARKLEGWRDSARDSRRDSRLDRDEVALNPRMTADCKSAPRPFMGRERYAVIRERARITEYATERTPEGVWVRDEATSGAGLLDSIEVVGTRRVPTDVRAVRASELGARRAEDRAAIRADEQRRDRAAGLRPKRGSRGRKHS